MHSVFMMIKLLTSVSRTERLYLHQMIFPEVKRIPLTQWIVYTKCVSIYTHKRLHFIKNAKKYMLFFLSHLWDTHASLSYFHSSDKVFVKITSKEYEVLNHNFQSMGRSLKKQKISLSVYRTYKKMKLLSKRNHISAIAKNNNLVFLTPKQQK